MEIPKENKDPRSLLNEKLFDAARAGSSQEVKKFIEDGASTDGYKNTYGLTALMMAAGRGQDECLRLLVAAKADVDMTSNKCETALIEAARNGNDECVRQLLAAKADVDMADEDGYTALMMAANNGNDECVSQLLAAKADVDMTNEDGETALMMAALWGHDECVKLLLAAKADVDMTNYRGSTALHWASWNGHTDIVQQLIGNGISRASINKKDDDGRTPLQKAREYGNTSTADVLVAAGATE